MRPLLWQPKWRLACIKRRYSVKALKNPKSTPISRKMWPLPWQSKWCLDAVHRTGSVSRPLPWQSKWCLDECASNRECQSFNSGIVRVPDSLASNDMTTWTGSRKIRHFTVTWTWTLDMATSEKSTLVEVDPDPSVIISEEDESETRTSKAVCTLQEVCWIAFLNLGQNPPN